jgi:hypothetical protein
VPRDRPADDGADGGAENHVARLVDVLVQPRYGDIGRDEIGRDPGAVAQMLLKNGRRRERGGRVAGRECETGGARPICLEGTLAPHGLLHPDHDRVGQQLRFDLVHAEMLQPATPFAPADQVRRGARAEQDRRLSDDLPGLEERIRRAHPFEPPIDLVVLRMDGRGEGASSRQEVQSVFPGEMLDVVFQVVPQRREEAPRRLGGCLGDGDGRLLRGILGLRRRFLRKRPGR